MFSKSISLGRAFGRGEWTKVIELAEQEDCKVYRYTMIAYI